MQGHGKRGGVLPEKVDHEGTKKNQLQESRARIVGEEKGGSRASYKRSWASRSFGRKLTRTKKGKGWERTASVSIRKKNARAWPHGGAVEESLRGVPVKGKGVQGSGGGREDCGVRATCEATACPGKKQKRDQRRPAPGKKSSQKEGREIFAWEGEKPCFQGRLGKKRKKIRGGGLPPSRRGKRTRKKKRAPFPFPSRSGGGRQKRNRRELPLAAGSKKRTNGGPRTAP